MQSSTAWDRSSYGGRNQESSVTIASPLASERKNGGFEWTQRHGSMAKAWHFQIQTQLFHLPRIGAQRVNNSRVRSKSQAYGSVTMTTTVSMTIAKSLLDVQKQPLSLLLLLLLRKPTRHLQKARNRSAALKNTRK